MQLIAFTVAGLMAMIVGYALGLPGAVVALIFLFILFNGVLVRWAQPLINWIRS